MHTHIDTYSIPAGRSLTHWREAVSANLVGVECIANPQLGLKGRFTQLATDEGFAIARLHAEAHQAVRESSTLRNSGTDFYILFLQKSGEMKVRRPGQDFVVGPGGMYFYDGVSEHSLIFDHEFDHLAVRVPKLIVEKKWGALAEVGSFHLPASEDVVDRVLVPMAEAALSARSSFGLTEVVQSVFELFSSKAFKDIAIPLGAPSYARLALARVIRKIEISLEDPEFTIEDVSSYLGMSRRNTDRLIASCGTSFSRVLLKKRLERAADFLVEEVSLGMSVTEIALAVGFENHSFFSRKFKEYFTLTPKQYRMRAIKANVRYRTDLRPC